MLKKLSTFLLSLLILVGVSSAPAARATTTTTIVYMNRYWTGDYTANSINSQHFSIADGWWYVHWSGSCASGDYFSINVSAYSPNYGTGAYWSSYIGPYNNAYGIRTATQSVWEDTYFKMTVNAAPSCSGHVYINNNYNV